MPLFVQREIPNMVTRPFIANIARIIWFNCRIVVAFICGNRHCSGDRISNLGCVWVLSCHCERQ